MCGIVGVASVYPVEERRWLKDGIQRLAHRGPDGDGEYWSEDGRVGLGHRRLAILDLSESGAQPMVSKDGDAVIIFNGEIYNFQDLRVLLATMGFVFRSNSDTEILLTAYAAWGVDCLDRIEGMYAFAVFDRKRNVLFFARDRAGEKPLFFHHANGVIHFGSELKGILANPQLPRRLDAAALDSYLAFGYVMGEQCILEGYRKLAPGHAMEFCLRSGALRTWRYWAVPPYIEETALAPDQGLLVEELEALLEESVTKQLVADVPVGVLLSGGVDSSLITALAVRSSESVRTFTVGFPGDERKDESGHARLIARHFGTRHTELSVPDFDAGVLATLAVALDEPMADGSIIPTYLICRTIKQQCTVALGGDGADELFGGYHSYARQLQIVERFGWVPVRMRAPVARGLLRVMPLGAKGRGLIEQLGKDFSNGIPWSTFVFDEGTRERFLRSYRPGRNVEAFYESLIVANGDVIEKSTRLDYQIYLPDDILVKVDRCSMANSLEVRAPFLSRKIIEFAFSRVPSRYKVTATEKKIILKQLARKLLPGTFDLVRKQGFSPPLAAWFKVEPLRSLLRDTLLVGDGLFAQRPMEKLLSKVEVGRNADRVLAVLMLELWRREFSVN